MSAAFLALDCDKNCLKYLVKRSKVVIVPANDDKSCDRQKWDPEFFIGWFVRNLQYDKVFRLRVRQVLRARDQPVIVEVTDPRYNVDYKSCEMSLVTTYELVELLTMLSWFSTFGGAYSNLGDEFEKCAEMAGKISVHQMKLAFQLGDPFLIARCKLYYSIALIQRGQLKPAKRIVRKQYEFAKSEKEADIKLLKMCLGVWSKLMYAKELQQRQRNLENTSVNKAI